MWAHVQWLRAFKKYPDLIHPGINSAVVVTTSVTGIGTSKDTHNLYSNARKRIALVMISRHTATLGNT